MLAINKAAGFRRVTQYLIVDNFKFVKGRCLTTMSNKWRWFFSRHRALLYADGRQEDDVQSLCPASRFAESSFPLPFIWENSYPGQQFHFSSLCQTEDFKVPFSHLMERGRWLDNIETWQACVLYRLTRIGGDRDGPAASFPIRSIGSLSHLSRVVHCEAIDQSAPPAKIQSYVDGHRTCSECLCTGEHVSLCVNFIGPHVVQRLDYRDCIYSSGHPFLMEQHFRIKRHAHGVDIPIAVTSICHSCLVQCHNIFYFLLVVSPHSLTRITEKD